MRVKGEKGGGGAVHPRSVADGRPPGGGAGTRHEDAAAAAAGGCTPHSRPCAVVHMSRLRGCLQPPPPEGGEPPCGCPPVGVSTIAQP